MFASMTIVTKRLSLAKCACEPMKSPSVAGAHTEDGRNAEAEARPFLSASRARGSMSFAQELYSLRRSVRIQVESVLLNIIL